ncbi:exodeoxyribonuclease VII large subunit [Bifidobacterium pseudolongum]|uniref:exodeoxyribonuclease VII large subunit n=1 Tax=Bifidobacterium pseudolongum TaxID=1694 RepID=UPI000C6FDA04|nr:exodeoxyribonuclease VII large subunit [Bifidobacterium pseudolongum]MCH4850282.1 exodeoxyribonuclease VII large subunit [Bifidobacterium pseudolongum]PKU99312.1 exodeoxyribonuclease VII large subunit [Bifidobacterium pseudolongum subsp. globosum]RYQ23587.1 exodeoxyribonuclease VII large subunit [Bifidobacterium pseudolongum subsp. globosum]RYQ48726.1 exodeoxyribonuclease VII large subunit [Bifidobacterium pseudolongum subsp. globosum]RYQ54610.1 exodeoxyribonuclease VII large subunit [Bifid
MVWNNNNGSGGAGSPLDRPRTADELPRFARDTTPENPWPVSLLSQHFHDAVERWPAAWIEGQIIEINARRTGTVYLTLRDSFQEVSISALGFGAFAQKARAFQQGDRVVMHGQADLWVKSTRLSFRADDIRRIGSGGIKEQIDELRKKLKGEGLFDESNKVPIPEFPTTIGIVCGPGARAEGDIITNVNLRWPIVNFAVKYAHVQGPQCPTEVVQAIQELDADPAVDVIIVARGGGSFEDLIGFSDERVVRATAACVTPIISAVGHEDDWTLIDLASDMRASTPTDAAKRVVPDVREQQQLVASAIGTMSMRMRAMVDNESRLIEGYVNRPSLTHPQTMVESHERDIADAVRAMRIGLTRIVDDAQMHVEKLKATLTALSPQSTLDRGYAVLQNASGHVVDDAGDVHVGDELTITLRHGTVVAQAQATHV